MSRISTIGELFSAWIFQNDDDDFSADTSTEGRVTVGGSATGEIEADNDRDWFAVTLKAGRTYRIDLEGEDTDKGTLGDPWLFGIYDSNGRRIVGPDDDDSGVGYNSRVEFTPDADGTYYVSASSAFKDVDRTGTYTLTVVDTEAETDDFADDTSTTGQVAVGGSTNGEIEVEGDRDWFAVTLEAGRTYRIDLEGGDTDLGTLTDPYLRGIYDADGALIKGQGTSNDDGGDGLNSRVEFTPEEDGTYYVAASGYGNETGTYTLSVAATDEFTADTSTAGRVEVGGRATGWIENSGDRDWFAVNLKAGKAYRIELDGLIAGPDYDWPVGARLLGVYDADGDLIDGTSNDNRGDNVFNSRLRFTPDEDGTYYVAAAVSSAGTIASETGPYRLSVAEDDFAQDLSTTGKVQVDGSVMGEIESAGDRDWFAVTLEAGLSYRIDLEAADTNKGSLGDPFLWGIYDPDGDLIRDSSNNDGGEERNSRVVLKPEEGGTYYVAASGAFGSSRGTYTLSVTADDFAADTDTAGQVSVNSSVTGKIEQAGDRDWFAVTLQAERTYQFDLEGDDTNQAALGDPYLFGIYGADGALIKDSSNDDGGDGLDSRVLLSVEEGGIYYVSASGYGNETGAYTLFVAVADDFAADSSTTGQVTVDGSVTGEIEKAGDRDWFAVTLEAGRTYGIYLDGRDTNDGTLPDPNLHGIYDANSALIPNTSNNDGGVDNNSRVEFTPEEDGTYYVSAGGIEGNAGTYTLSVIEDDFSSDTSTAGRVELFENYTQSSGTSTGEIERAGDRDWFAVTLQAGQIYLIDLTGDYTNPVSDPYVFGIHNGLGELIEGTPNDNTGDTFYSSRVEFTPEQDGTYYVSIGSVSADTGAYELHVAADDFADDTSTTGQVSVGGDSPLAGIDSPGERDWFAVTLQAGQAYQIDVDDSISITGDPDAYVEGVYDANGELIEGTSSDDGGDGLKSRVEFTPDEDGTYYVSAIGANVGTYRLSVNADDFADDTSTTGRIPVGGDVVWGRVDSSGDRDWFACALKAGQTYRINLEGVGGGPNPYLFGVYDGNGALIKEFSTDDGISSRSSQFWFTPEEHGSYYVSVGSEQPGAGEYAISVVVDDFAGDGSTTGQVSVGGSVTGKIDKPGQDTDWFAVTLAAGGTYRIDLEGHDTNQGTLDDPFLAGVYDDEGAYISGTRDPDGGDGRNSRVEFTPEEDGTYYVAVAVGSSYTEGGTYTLFVSDTRDFSADASNAGRVSVGGSVTSEIDSPGDRDWFAVTLQAGQTYRIDLEGNDTNQGTLTDPYLRGIYDANGNIFDATSNDDGGDGVNSRVRFTPQVDGIYYLSAGGFADNVGTYKLFVDRDDLRADTSTAGRVSVDGSVKSRIESPGDSDWFAVSLRAGQAYRIDLEGSETDQGTLADPELSGIYDADGVLIPGTANDDGGEGRNSRVEFTPEADGTYYISAGVSANRYGGTYTLSVVDTGDFAADTSTAGRVSVGGSVPGEIEESGDRDWFAVTLQAGQLYRIDLEGSDTNQGTLLNPHLYGIYDADGEYIPGTTGGTSYGRNSEIEFVPEEDGTYYVSATGVGVGTYTLSVDTDDFADDTSTTGRVPVGGSITGEIENLGDWDWFAVTLQAGHTYRIDLEGRATERGTLEDPMLEAIYDTNGERVSGTGNDDGGEGYNSRVEFTPEEDGTYYVWVRGFALSTGTYMLSVTEVDDGTSGAGVMEGEDVSSGVPDMAGHLFENDAEQPILEIHSYFAGHYDDPDLMDMTMLGWVLPDFDGLP